MFWHFTPFVYDWPLLEDRRGLRIRQVVWIRGLSLEGKWAQGGEEIFTTLAGNFDAYISAIGDMFIHNFPFLQLLSSLPSIGEIPIQSGNPGVFHVLELIGGNIIIDAKLNPDLPFDTMTNINYRFPVHANGQKAASWAPEKKKKTSKTIWNTPFCTTNWHLNGQFFKILGARIMSTWVNAVRSW